MTYSNIQANRPNRFFMSTLVGAGILLAVAASASTGVVVSRDSREADWLSTLARNGDDGAQLQLGLAYREGRYGLSPDEKTGLYWLKASAEQGNAYAADLVANAAGKAGDRQQAEQWWQQAAEHGNADAQRRLGQQLLAEGHQAEGLEWLRRAADQGDRAAHAEMAALYRHDEVSAVDLHRGEGVVAALGARLYEPSLTALSALLDTLAQSSIEQQSLNHLRALAEQGDPVAEYQLGLHYRDGAWAVERDPQQSTEWLRKAAKAGNRLALNTLQHPAEF